MRLFANLMSVLAVLSVVVCAGCTSSGPSAKGGKLGMAVNNPSDIANTLSEVGAVFEYPAPSVAADGTVAETAIGLVGPGPISLPVGSIWIHPTAAMTATDASNYATITVSKRTAGGSAVTIGQITTQPTANGGSGSWVAFTPFQLTLQSGTGSYLAAGDSVTYKVTQTGSGSANATGAFYIAGYVKSY